MAEKIPNIRGLDLVTNRAKLDELIQLLYGLRNLNVQLVVGQTSQQLNPGITSIVGNPANLVLPIPVKFAKPIPDNDGTLASVAAQLNLLCAALRSTGQLPL